MKYKKMIKKMKKMQNRLNVRTAGSEWTSGVAQNGKEINWWRCVYMELAEFIDSFPWKHWKDVDAEPDMENAKTELVDVAHFLLSLAVVYNVKLKEIVGSYKFAKKRTKEYESGQNPIAIAEILMMHSLSQSYNPISAETRNILDTIGLEQDIEKSAVLIAFDAFFELCMAIDMDVEELYARYLAKNVLNEFRQDFGYQEGEYEKVWKGEEDNVWAVRFAFKNTDSSSLYEALKDFYNNSVCGKETDSEKDPNL